MRHGQGYRYILTLLTFGRAIRAGGFLLPLLCSGIASATAPDADLHVQVTGLRSTRGLLLVCLTRRAEYFPDCSNDPEKRHYVVPATQADDIRIPALPPGGYALSLIHDENGNRRLDTFARIPREGIGFSQNPTIRFGAPSFAAVRFMVGDVAVRQQVRIKYFL